MGFRTKIIILASLLNLLLFGFAWQLLSGQQATRKQIQLFVPASGYLQGISAVHSSLTRQTKEVLDYLISHDPDDLKEFAVTTREIQDYFKLWQESAEQQKTLGYAGEEEDLALFTETFNIYRDWQRVLDEIFTLERDERHEQALHAFRQNWQLYGIERLLPVLDQALDDGMSEVEDIFHDLLLAVGGTPFGDRVHRDQLELIHVSMDYLLGGNRVNTSVNTQFIFLVDYLLHGTPDSLLQFDNGYVISNEALSFWQNVTERRAQLENITEQAARINIADVDSSYQRFLLQAEKAIRLKREGHTDEALNLILAQGDTHLADFQQSASQAIQDGASRLTEETARHQTLWLILLALTLCSCGLLSLGIVRTMLASLKTLSHGMDAIRSGDLGHRIAMPENDILGKLAQTFNRMMDSLCRTQQSLEELTADLEHRVEARTAQLESANRDLEAFNSMISHDLRLPITIAYGYSELLLAEFQETGQTKAAENLRQVFNACDDMSRIVSTLEALSRAKQQPLRKQAVPLDEMVRKIFEQLLANDPHHPAQLAMEDNTPAAFGDSDLLEIVIANLVGNAWKYSSKVASPRIEFGARDLNNGRITWFIRDNGSGFDMSKSDQLFQTFGRLHSAKEFPGTGIGLATVQRIIQRHGGEIWAEGKPGQGATFYFHLGEQPQDAITPAEPPVTCQFL